MEDNGRHFIHTHMPNSKHRDICPPVLTSLLHLIAFDTLTLVLDQWKHPSLASWLVGGWRRGEGGGGGEGKEGEEEERGGREEGRKGEEKGCEKKKDRVAKKGRREERREEEGGKRSRRTTLI